MQHPALADLLDPVMSLYTDVRKKSLMRLEYEGLSKCEAVTASGARLASQFATSINGLVRLN